MTLLQQRDVARLERRLVAYAETRQQLRGALAELIPGREVIVFGSLTKPGVFNDRSDVDLALSEPTSGIETLHLTAELTDRLCRPVDLIRLDQSRFREKILREGERWTA